MAATQKLSGEPYRFPRSKIAYKVWADTDGARCCAVRLREKRWRFISIICALSMLMQLSLVDDALAIDIQPRDYVSLPSGTNVMAVYYLLGDYRKLNTAGVTIGGDTHLQSSLGVFRYLYYGDVEGRSYALQFALPAGTFRGKINGRKLAIARGVGDFVLSGGISLLPRPRSDVNIAVVSYTSLPTGDYSASRVLNLGSNRWSEDLQFGYTQAIGDRIWLDVAADVVLYGVNTDIGQVHQKLTKQPTYQFQSWLSYVFSNSSLISIGHSALLGGKERIGGIANGLESESQQIRLAYSQFLSPSFQILGSLTDDIYVVGEFKQTFGLTMRAAYLF